MVKRRSLFVLVSLILVIVLAACSNQSSSGQEGSGDERELVVIFNGGDGIGGGVAEEIIKEKEEEFEAEGITRLDQRVPLNLTKFLNEELKKKGVKLIYEDWGWSEPLVQKQTTAFLAGEGPDVIVGETQSPGFAAQGLLEPFPDWLAEEIRSNIVEGAWKPMELDGKIYGVAMQPGVSNLYWNKELFRKAGLDPERPPTTWDEMLEMAQQINNAGEGEFFAGGIYAGPNNGGYLRFGAFPLMNGGGWVDDNNQPIFNHEGNIKAFEFLRELNQYNPPGLMANNEEASFWEAFQSDQLAFVMDGPWRAQICRDLEQDCGMAVLPIPVGGEAGNITIGAAFHSVPTFAKNKEDAWEYISLKISNDAQQIIADGNVRPTIRNEIAETEEYKENHPEMYSVYLGLKGNVQGLPTFDKENSRAWQIYGEAMVKAMMTEEPIADILEDAQKRVLEVTQ